jgi:hypothetical protein
MSRSIGREVIEIEQAMARCHGDAVAEPRLTGSWMAHLLVSSRAAPQPVDRYGQAAPADQRSGVTGRVQRR